MVGEMRIRTSIVILIGLMLFCGGCKKSGPIEPISPPEPLPDDLALFASIDGNWTGIQVFNANTLEKIDSFETTPLVPFSLEFSPNYSRWYTIVRPTLVSIETRSKKVVQSVTTKNPFIISDRNKQFIISYFTDTTQVFERQTLNLVQNISIGFIDKMIASASCNKIYGLYYDGETNIRGVRIVVYDMQESRIDRRIDLTNDISARSKMQSSALAISPDGRFLFVTVFNWRGGGGYGSFHAIDLTNDQVVAEYPCGKFSQMGVSPNGRYVYISDPAGYLYEMIPTDHLLRYDIHARTMEVFINGLRNIGLIGNVRMITDQVVIAPDDRTMFLTLSADAKTPDGKLVHMIKLDTHTKKILAAYHIPPDYRGYITQHIRKLKLGKY